jgi:hypothetical protein
MGCFTVVDVTKRICPSLHSYARERRAGDGCELIDVVAKRSKEPWSERTHWRSAELGRGHESTSPFVAKPTEARAELEYPTTSTARWTRQGTSRTNAVASIQLSPNPGQPVYTPRIPSAVECRASSLVCHYPAQPVRPDPFCCHFLPFSGSRLVQFPYPSRFQFLLPHPAFLFFSSSSSSSSSRG